MTDIVGDLLKLMDLERLEVDLFRGHSPKNTTSKRVFGGQVVAQSLVAAYRTINSDERACHSLHAYFIRPGDPAIPIIYEVDRARDGGSFSTRRVIAIQHGRQIFNMAASFHKQEQGWNHQHDMPQTVMPESLNNRVQRYEDSIDLIPEQYRDFFQQPKPIEIRDINPLDLINPEKTDDAQYLWFRVARTIDTKPDWLHHCLIAYASDMALLGSGNRRHGISWLSDELMAASLDHAMWFHAPINFNDWHLYAMDSPYAGGARSFNRGSIYTRKGQLVASVAQEGLMRPRKRAYKSKA